MKYLVTAGTSSAVLLFGLALMYASQGRGTLNILEMGRNWAAADRSLSGAGLYLRHFAPMLTGLAMVLCGAAFKLGAAPFHLWTADVYQGSGAPATSLIATASKTAMVGLVLRWTAALELNSNVGLALVIAFLAAASMVTGNLLALWQHNLKRRAGLFVDRSHGLRLGAGAVRRRCGVAGGGLLHGRVHGDLGGALGVVNVLETAGEDDRGEGYRGLWWRRRGMAVALALMLLSLAGLPLTGGFVGKLLIVQTGISGGHAGLIILLAACSGAGLVYYLRIALAMFQRQDTPAQPPASARSGGEALVWTMAALLVTIGVFPWVLEQAIAWFG